MTDNFDVQKKSDIDSGEQSIENTKKMRSMDTETDEIEDIEIKISLGIIKTMIFKLLNNMSRQYRSFRPNIKKKKRWIKIAGCIY